MPALPSAGRCRSRAFCWLRLGGSEPARDVAGGLRWILVPTRTPGTWSGDIGLDPASVSATSRWSNWCSLEAPSPERKSALNGLSLSVTIGT